MAQSETILSAQSHPGDSSIQTVTGDKYKGDGYYSRSDGFHTVQYTLDDFLGDVSFEATLAVSPTSSDWFTVHTASFTNGTTDSKIAHFTGNYVWVRAVIGNWTQGTVQNIKINH